MQYGLLLKGLIYLQSLSNPHKAYKMKVFLLTHAKELHRKTNTGSLAVKLLGDKVQVILWERTKPNEELLAFIKREILP